MIKKLLLILLFFSLFSYCNAGVTSTGLLLQYKFQGNLLDSSGRNRETIFTGVTTKYDSKQDINFAVFSGGKISTNLGWSTDEYGKYTISFWYKGTTQSIITSGVSNFALINNSCTFFGQIVDCSSILDNKWHNFILRKNGKYNLVYIDGKKLLDYQGIVGALNYNISLSFGNLAMFRIYDRDLTLDEISSLYIEYKYLQNAVLDDFEYFVNPTSWSNLNGTGNYSVSFNVKHY